MFSQFITLRAKHRPIIIITSNRTRDLHDALKRRCIYHWIDYPTRAKELEIVRCKAPGTSERLAAQVVDFVQATRRQDLTKQPGVAETLDWVEALEHLGVSELSSVAQSLPQVECFVFGTRLTRITGQLKLRNIDQAIDQASREVVDWAGGTRIGESLRVFNRHWSRRVLGRGAVALLISDGWEQGDPAVLADEVRRLQRRCHRLIWLNPLLGRETYQSRVGGMQAVLPYIDDFLPIHNFHSLEALAQRLGALDGRRGR